MQHSQANSKPCSSGHGVQRVVRLGMELACTTPVKLRMRKTRPLRRCLKARERRVSRSMAAYRRRSRLYSSWLSCKAHLLMTQTLSHRWPLNCHDSYQQIHWALDSKLHQTAVSLSLRGLSSQSGNRNEVLHHSVQIGSFLAPPLPANCESPMFLGLGIQTLPPNLVVASALHTYYITSRPDREKWMAT